MIDARLEREACLEKKRPYYHANRDTLCKQQNAKYQERKQMIQNDPNLIAKKREVSKAYYYRNKDCILPTKTKKEICQKSCQGKRS